MFSTSTLSLHPKLHWISIPLGCLTLTAHSGFPLESLSFFPFLYLINCCLFTIKYCFNILILNVEDRTKAFDIDYEHHYLNKTDQQWKALFQCWRLNRKTVLVKIDACMLVKRRGIKSDSLWVKSWLICLINWIWQII